MTERTFPGEFEQMVLLAIIKQDNAAYGPEVSRELEASTGRSVSRGALYTTLDRMESKGWITWELETAGERASQPRRRFTVTSAGIEVLRTSRDALLNLWKGTEKVLGGSGS